MNDLVAGIILAGLGVAVALFGDKDVNPRGGAISKLFSLPRTNAKGTKWGAALALIAFGVFLILGAGRQ